MDRFAWSDELAYAVGLLVTDGSLSKDGRHIDLTSKDIEQLKNFRKCLDVNTKISSKSAGTGNRRSFRVQFSDVELYRFLNEIGLKSAKTKTISQVKVPDKYFAGFLRGHHDGDGSFYSYWDKRWKSSFMFYLTFISASMPHIVWLENQISRLVGVNSSLNESNGIFRIRYAKSDSIKLLKYIYPDEQAVCLSRKRLKIERALSTIGLSLN